MSDPGLRAISAAGVFVLLAIAWLASSDRRHVRWHTVGWAMAIQLALAILLLRTAFGRVFFIAANDAVNGFVAYTDEGVRFVFGALAATGFSFVVNVLPVIVFMGALFSVLYHLRIVQPVVAVFARVLSRSLGISGAESLSAVANVFLGMV